MVGGVFRDSSRFFLGGYYIPLGDHTAYYAEIFAAILAIELAFNKGWRTLWLECDSTFVLHFLLTISLFNLLGTYKIVG